MMLKIYLNHRKLVYCNVTNKIGNETGLYR